MLYINIKIIPVSDLEPIASRSINKPISGGSGIMLGPNHLHPVVKLITLASLDEEQLRFSC